MHKMTCWDHGEPSEFEPLKFYIEVMLKSQVRIYENTCHQKIKLTNYCHNQTKMPKDTHF